MAATQTTGAQRAAARLAAKAQVLDATYAHLQPAKPARQQVRREARKAAKADASAARRAVIRNRRKSPASRVDA